MTYRGVRDMILMKDIVLEDHPVLRDVAEEVALSATEEDKETARRKLE